MRMTMCSASRKELLGGGGMAEARSMEARSEPRTLAPPVRAAVWRKKSRREGIPAIMTDAGYSFETELAGALAAPTTHHEVTQLVADVRGWGMARLAAEQNPSG